MATFYLYVSAKKEMSSAGKGSLNDEISRLDITDYSYLPNDLQFYVNNDLHVI